MWLDERKITKYQPLFDACDRGDHYLFTFDLPHVRKEDVHVYLKEAQLVIHAETSFQDEDGSEAHLVYDREMSLPLDADLSSIRVAFKDGLLRVYMGKTGGARREIPVY